MNFNSIIPNFNVKTGANAYSSNVPNEENSEHSVLIYSSM